MILLDVCFILVVAPLLAAMWLTGHKTKLSSRNPLSQQGPSWTSGARPDCTWTRSPEVGEDLTAASGASAGPSET